MFDVIAIVQDELIFIGKLQVVVANFVQDGGTENIHVGFDFLHRHGRNGRGNGRKSAATWVTSGNSGTACVQVPWLRKP